MLRAPDVKYLGEEPQSYPQLERQTATYENLSKRFILPSNRAYQQQYSHVYHSRLLSVRKHLLDSAKEKWAGENVEEYMDAILDMKKGQKCVILGTIYKDMKLKPNILDEYHARENYEAPPPARSKYTDPSDSIIVEDHSGRASLAGANLPTSSLVTGCDVAVLGHENEDGEFVVQDICFPFQHPQRPVPSFDEDRYVCLLSGLNVNADTKNFSSLSLMLDVLSGLAGGDHLQEKMSKICRCIIAGNSICPSTGAQDNLALYQRKNMVPETVEHVRLLDKMLGQVAATVAVDLMPGPNDPSTRILPQQPLHPCMFPVCRQSSGMKSVPNPYDFVVDGVHMIGTSGQNVDDVYRFSETESRLDILHSIITWGHLFPTAPDTLPVFPYNDADFRDPFVLQSYPHVLFAGNQPSFSTTVFQGHEGKHVRLINVPDFSKTSSIVLLNLKTLECEELSFAQDGDADTEVDMDVEADVEAEATTATVVMETSD